MAAKVEVDMSRICEKCRYIEDYDHVFTIDEIVDRRDEKHTGLGRLKVLVLWTRTGIAIYGKY